MIGALIVLFGRHVRPYYCYYSKHRSHAPVQLNTPRSGLTSSDKKRNVHSARIYAFSSYAAIKVDTCVFFDENKL